MSSWSLSLGAVEQDVLISVQNTEAMEDHRKRQTKDTDFSSYQRFSFRDFILLLLAQKKTNANVALSIIRIFNSLFITDATTAPL